MKARDYIRLEDAYGARNYKPLDVVLTRGLLCKETHQHVLRLAPPLIITQDEVDWALEQIEAVLTSL